MSDKKDDGNTQRLVDELAEVRRRMALRAQKPPIRNSNSSGAYDAIKEPIVTDPPEPPPDPKPPKK